MLGKNILRQSTDQLPFPRGVDPSQLMKFEMKWYWLELLNIIPLKMQGFTKA